MLLGQAESGKSTLQKQFQLYYASQTLDKERPSWRPIVYSNILKALRMIFEELDRQYSAPAPPTADTAVTSPSSLSMSSSTSSATIVASAAWPSDLQSLYTTLAPLVANEDALAAEVSGGITVSGGRTGVYVRAGWQTLITPNRAWPLPDIRGGAARPADAASLVAQLLLETRAEVAELWQHPVVRKLLSTNKVRLEESASL